MNIKEELFFLKKLAGEGYLSYLPPYLKNRFFGRYLFEGVPLFNSDREDDFELHILSRAKDLWMLNWSLRSFLYYSGLRPRIFIHDDGSFVKNITAMLESKFPSLKVISKEEADKFILSRKDIPQTVREHRRLGHKLIYKLVDIFLMSRGKTMVLDSDILFFKKPSEIVDLISGKTANRALISRHDGPYNLKMDREYSERYNLDQREVPFMNSGLIIFDKRDIPDERLFEYFEHSQRDVKDYFVEMTGWGCLISQTDCRFLPLSQYIIKGRPGSDTTMKHFTGPRRHELYAYGIDLVRKDIKQ